MLARPLAPAVAAPAVFEAVAAEARARLEDDELEFSRHELAVLGWSLAAADARAAGDVLCGNASPFGASPYARVCESYGLDGADAGTLTQLWQWTLWRRECDARWEGLSAGGEAACRESFLREAVGAPSTFEESVRAALESMGLRAEQKVRTDAGYVIDLVVEAPGRRRRVGIEVDGPQQFKRGRGGAREATGATKLKRRQARSSTELPIMSIPYWEWETLCLGDDSPAKKTNYLTFAFAVRIGSRAGAAARKPAASALAPAVAPAVASPATPPTPAPEPPQPTASVPMAAEAEAGSVQPRFLTLPSEASSAAAAASVATQIFSLRADGFGRPMARSAAVDAAAAASVVLIGEVYAQPPVITFECEVLRGMIGRAHERAREHGTARAVVHVVLEHFNFRHQPWLDAFMSAEMSFDELVTAGHPLAGDGALRAASDR